MEFEVYQDKAGEWRWRLKAENNKIVADSGEGYNSKQGCLDGIDVVKGCSDAKVVVLDS